MGFLKELKEKKLSKHYAPVQTNLLVRADRINQRIQDLVDKTIARQKIRTPRRNITEKDLQEILAGIRIIIAQELNTKGKEEWKYGYKRENNRID